VVSLLTTTRYTVGLRHVNATAFHGFLPSTLKAYYTVQKIVIEIPLKSARNKHGYFNVTGSTVLKIGRAQAIFFPEVGGAYYGRPVIGQTIIFLPCDFYLSSSSSFFLA